MNIGNSSYVHLTEGTRPVDDGHNRVYYCELNRYHSENVFRNYSIKFTLEGEVHYKTSQQHYRLLPGYFLLSSKQPCECIVDSKSVTRNLSIDISSETMDEVFATLFPLRPDDLDHHDQRPFTTFQFFEQLYPTDLTKLGQYLQRLSLRLQSNSRSAVSFSEETFYTMAEKVIEHETGIRSSLENLDSVKSSTRKETLRRLLAGKFYIDEHFLTDLHIPAIARQAHLSQYYFIRNFKRAFNASPYQYLLQKRLDHGRKLLEQKIALPEVADTCGFPDVSSFSKSFKQRFGRSPSMLFTQKT